MKKIGVLTSGGDSPGMNACIRAVVRKAIYENLEVAGIRKGYAGLIEGDIIQLKASSVSGIINQGGTILLTARSEEFKTKEGQRKAVENLRKNNIESLLIIGGDGSFHGASELEKKWNFPTIGIPGTIDNDIYGTDFTIGFATAVRTALEAIDKLRDTATSHERLFIIEVMGRNSGYIALYTALAGGAEEVLIPETPTDLDRVCQKLEEGKKRGKLSSIMIVAEGDEEGGAPEIAAKIKGKTGYDTRVAILGHLQRGGIPTASDRILASRLGVAAMDCVLKGERNKMVGIVNHKIKITPLEYSWQKKKEVNLNFYKINEILAT